MISKKEKQMAERIAKLNKRREMIENFNRLKANGVVVPPMLNSANIKFIFSPHARDRLWERFGKGYINTKELKPIPDKEWKQKKVKVKRGHYVWGNDDMILIVKQKAPSTFIIITALPQK